MFMFMSCMFVSCHVPSAPSQTRTRLKRALAAGSSARASSDTIPHAIPRHPSALRGPLPQRPSPPSRLPSLFSSPPRPVPTALSSSKAHPVTHRCSRTTSGRIPPRIGSRRCGSSRSRCPGMRPPRPTTLTATARNSHLAQAGTSYPETPDFTPRGLSARSSPRGAITECAHLIPAGGSLI